MSPKVLRWLLTLLVVLCSAGPVWSASAAPSEVIKADQILDQIAKEADGECVSDSSFDALAKILEKDPNNFRAHLILGNCYDYLGLPEMALEQYQLAVKCAPNDPKAQVGLIKADIKAGKLVAASRLLEDARNRQPDNPELMFWQGNLLYAKNKMPEAEKLFDQALKSKDEVLGLPSALSVIRFSQRRYEDAYDLAAKDLAKDPKLKLANEVAGVALIKLQRFSEAVVPLKVAFYSNPLKNIISEDYAEALYWTGDYVNALRPALVNLAVTADLHGNNVISKTLLGRILRHVGKRDIANTIKEVSGRLGIDKNAAFHFSLGDVLDRYGYRDLAIEQYRRGLEIEPAFGRGWYRLGIDLEMQAHDYPQALDCLRKAKALLPEDESIAKHLLRLEDRWSTYHSDWSWQFKDWLKKVGLLK